MLAKIGHGRSRNGSPPLYDRHVSGLLHQPRACKCASVRWNGRVLANPAQVRVSERLSGNFIAALNRCADEKYFFVLTRMVQRSKVSHALPPRSPRSSRIGTQGRTRHDALSQCRQFAPTRATSARDTHSAAVTHAKRVCAQRRFVMTLRSHERSPRPQEEGKPEHCCVTRISSGTSIRSISLWVLKGNVS